MYRWLPGLAVMSDVRVAGNSAAGGSNPESVSRQPKKSKPSLSLSLLFSNCYSIFAGTRTGTLLQLYGVIMKMKGRGDGPLTPLSDDATSVARVRPAR